MRAGKTLRQDDCHIEFAHLIADILSIASIDESQAVLIEALLRLGTEGVQVAQVELEVTQVIGGDLHAHGDGIASHVAPGHHTSSTDASSDLVGTGLGIQEVVAAQTTATSIVGLRLRVYENIFDGKRFEGPRL